MKETLFLCLRHDDRAKPGAAGSAEGAAHGNGRARRSGAAMRAFTDVSLPDGSQTRAFPDPYMDKTQNNFLFNPAYIV